MVCEESCRSTAQKCKKSLTAARNCIFDLPFCRRGNLAGSGLLRHTSEVAALT
jgi:hypothetical protein